MTIFVRQMINASVTVQYLCTKIRVEKIGRFVGSVLVIVLQLFLCLIFCSFFVLVLFHFCASETKRMVRFSEKVDIDKKVNSQV